MQVLALAAANDALRGPREVGGTNDVTVSNRVNLVDPLSENCCFQTLRI